MNLYSLKSEYHDALNALAVDEGTGELLGMDAVLAIQDDINTKLLNYAKFIKSLQAEHQAFKEEKARVEQEMKRRDKKIAALKSVITDNLARDSKIEDTQCRLSYRTATKVTVDNSELLPSEFIEHTPRINKAALKQALSRNAIEGAYLESVHHLQIK